MRKWSIDPQNFISLELFGDRIDKKMLWPTQSSILVWLADDEINAEVMRLMSHWIAFAILEPQSKGGRATIERCYHVLFTFVNSLIN